MPIITTHVSATNVAGGDFLALMAGASISSALGPALTFSQPDVTLWLGGTVWSVSHGISGIASGALAELTRISVVSGAQVFGMVSGINLVDVSGLLTNQGTISGEYGLSVTATNFDATLTIRNDGDILGDRYGLHQTLGAGASYCDLILRNRGLIAGEQGSLVSEDPDSFVSLVNFGTMRGNIMTSDGQDSITNRGTIEGSIFTGGGNDFVRLFKGLEEGNQVYLGEGTDAIELGVAGADVVDGGQGSDTATYYNARAVTVSLADASLNAGAAAGDVLFYFENVVGSNFGNDKLTGDALANILEGRGGNDSLVGGGGRDTLLGGHGQDTLTGGAGADVFQFSIGQLDGDIVTDFSNTGTTRDYIQFVSDILAGNLLPGPLPTSQFVARGDNRAQDADDVFIFRTTDQTLWYDHDGNGTLNAPQMIADFAAGVVLTAADIDIL